MKCNICGFEYFQPSFGGSGICPACDCGISPEVTKLRLENMRLEQELAKTQAELAEEKKKTREAQRVAI